MNSAGALGLAALVAACAAVQDPPGGPPDATPPVLIALHPDSGAIVPGFREPVRFEFGEVINERGLEALITVSPRHERLTIDWRREAVEVRPRDGWRPDVVYQVRLAPGVQDLRGNRFADGATATFSTGGGFPATALVGAVVNWEAGQRAAGALIEVIRPSDSLAYVARTDSTGTFAVPWLTPGRWIVYATIDQNTNGRRDLREAWDSVDVTVMDTSRVELWSVVRDTVGPALREVQRIDSATVRLQFAARLSPTAPTRGVVRAWLLPDTVAIGIAEVLLPGSVETPTLGDSVSLPDSLRALDDSARVPVDTTRAAPEPQIDSLLASRPPLPDHWVVRLTVPLMPGRRYLFEADATSPVGAGQTSRAVLALPEPPPVPSADTTATVRSDSTDGARR